MPTGAVLGMIGQAVGSGIAANNDQRQLALQGALNRQQINANEQMTGYNVGKQIELWKATSFPAQMEQIKKAGLSSGLIYGGSGAGGATANIAQGNVSAAKAPSGGHEAIDMLQMGLMDAQRKNIEADTANKLASTPNIQATLPKINAETENTIANTGNTKADTELKQVQTNIAKIDQYVKQNTQEEAIQLASWQVDKMTKEVENIFQANNLAKGTMTDRINLLKAEVVGKLLQNALTEAQTTTEKGKPAVQQAEIKLMGQDVISKIQAGIQKWDEIRLMGQNADTQSAAQQQQAFINDISESTKIPYQMVEKILQAVIFKGAINK